MMKTVNRYTTRSNSVYDLDYHIIWRTWYRQKNFVGDVETRLNEKVEDMVEVKVAKLLKLGFGCSNSFAARDL